MLKNLFIDAMRHLASSALSGLAINKTLKIPYLSSDSLD